MTRDLDDILDKSIERSDKDDIEATKDITVPLLKKFVKAKMGDSEKHEKKKEEHGNKMYLRSVFSCRYKSENKTYEMKVKTMKAEPVMNGILIEEGLNQYLHSMGFVSQMNWKKEIDGKLISGRIDYYRGDDKLGVELKSPVYVKKKKYKMKNYIDQARGYLWLAENQEPELDKVILLQLSATGRHEVTVYNGFTDDEIREAMKPNYPYYDGTPFSECKYCDLKDECSHYER